MSLPVEASIDDLQAQLQTSRAVVLTADTGSGKTTWLPLQLLGAPWLDGKKIVMLEPRRVAARSAAYRLAYHAGDAVGQSVGYSVRFDSKVSQATKLEVVTEGVLARRIANDCELSGVGLVIFDEFHERHLETDLALALTLECQKVFRPDLKILVMSATIDTAKISSFLHGVLQSDIPCVASRGTNFPVDVRYLTTQLHAAQVAEASARKAVEAHREHKGDILLFLPGKREIETAIEFIKAFRLPNTTVLPLHGDLAAAEQDLALRKPLNGERRVIVSTPIAESSVTVEGLTVVVDSGLARQAAFDPSTGIARLETVTITQDAAVQRSGRAGRVKPGVCYRMYTEAEFKRRPKTRVAEILRTDLAEATLRALSFGAQLKDLPLLDRPAQAMLHEAERLLADLGLYREGRLTEQGKDAARMPLPPRLAAMLAHSPSAVTAALAAEISEQDGFARNRLLEQLQRFVKKQDTAVEMGVLLLAYPDRIALRREPGRFILRSGKGLLVDRHNPLADAEFILAIDLADKGADAVLRNGAAVSRAEISERLTSRMEVKSVMREKGGRPREYEQVCLGAIVFAEKELELSPERRLELLLHEIANAGLHSLLDTETQNFCARVELLRRWGEDLPTANLEELAETLPEWLSAYLADVRALGEVTPALMHQAMLARFDYTMRQRIESLLPERLALPSGALHRIVYEGNTAKVSARIQEFFGLNRHPALAHGKLLLTLELLSPSRQPIATTQDLPAFWLSIYKDVRKEMRGRYPKHFWPEDPLSMQGTTGTKKAADRKKS